MNIVKSSRKKNGMTEKELARKCEVHQTYIEKLENGKRKPSIEMILKLSLVLSICPFVIFKEATNCCNECQLNCHFDPKLTE
ncbi:helix-turn-helix transcriptional regulator [Clostridium sp.]|uniref:helix-turn-helix domain-containing protein n=1 Tax=Clostridium sp. TaxID=1506 RepID=UPI00262476C0|nr:helix-turn-helix transcriptional regulator [Clostridium sp.]